MHNSASYSPILMLQSIYIMGNGSPDMLQKFQNKKFGASVIILHYYKLGLCLPYPDFVLQKAII